MKKTALTILEFVLCAIERTIDTYIPAVVGPVIWWTGKIAFYAFVIAVPAIILGAIFKWALVTLGFLR